ncbi:hypothetical protein C5167_022599 [Papaver somniferum]|uniref:Uncharacterized protein n=1 Tax=Papaver somniferum TaxID=3469 RepID=A0A4Y7JI71_PAPSO|nr:hypothetical protein C5167_022599 [Papaver somniferum]
MLCLAHTIWIGNTVAVATSIDLIGNHLFGVWNGDRRISSSEDGGRGGYGENGDVIRTDNNKYGGSGSERHQQQGNRVVKVKDDKDESPTYVAMLAAQDDATRCKGCTYWCTCVNLMKKLSAKLTSATLNVIQLEFGVVALYIIVHTNVN